MLLCPVTALANPTGGTVSAGQAGISQSGNTLDVNQTSNKAVIDWRGFDIAPGETTQFIQPGSSSITLNRVNSGGASQIMGTLTANGNIVIINPNGVLFGKGSNVDVNGLVATTANISNQNFMSGNMTFDQPGNPDASIINNGTITAQEAGLVGFVAPNVVNNGVITAKLGRVQLSSGDTATVDFYGDDLMEVAVSDNVKSQLVANAGTIQADGGKIALTAAAGSKIVNSLITMSGELQANTVGQKNGEIVIYAEGSNAVPNNIPMNRGRRSGNSRVQISGRINATGRNRNEQGGDVTVTGDDVALQAGTVIDTSGDIGGGTIRIGGETHGGGTTPTALNTTVESGVDIYADAITSGNGGSVTVWSDDTTNFAGNIYARGGALSGNGGNVETSGEQNLWAIGHVDTTAANGATGMWLLDPNNYVIDASTDTPGSFIYSIADVTSQLSSSNVTLSASGTFTLDFAGNTLTSNAGHTLTMAATSGFIINSDSTINNNANVTFTGAVNGASAGAQSLTVNAGTGAATFSSTIGATTALKNLSVTSDTVSFGGNIKGTGTLSLATSTAGQNMNLNNGTSNWYLTGAEVGYIQNTWTGVNIGNSSETGTMTLAADTWNAPTTFTTSGTGNITVTGGQTGGAAASLTFSGPTNLNYAGTDATTAAGNKALTFNNAVTLGANTTLTSGTGTMTFGSTVDGGSSLTTTAGTTNFNGAIGGGTKLTNFTVTTDNLTIGGNVTGSGTLTIAPKTASTNINLNNGTAGLYLTTTEWDDLQNSWTAIKLGASSDTGTMTIGALGATDLARPTTFGMATSGSINTNGAIMSGAALTFANNGGILTFGSTLDGANAISTVANTTNFNGAVGSITPLTSLTIQTDNLNLSSTLAGTATLFITPQTLSRNINLNNGTAGLYLTTTEINNIQNSWANIYFGTNTFTDTGTMTIGAANWTRPMHFDMNASGSINVTGAQTSSNSLAYNVQTGTLTFGAGGTLDGAGTVTTNAGTTVFNDTVGSSTPLGSLSITTDNLTVGASMTGSGSFTLAPETVTRAINLDNGTAGLYVNTAELGYIQNGWSSVNFGSTSVDTGSMTVGAATWTRAANFNMNSSGSINVSGAQTANANMTYNNGTGTITFGAGGTIDGTSAITVFAGTTLINGAFGSITPLSTLNITSDNITLANSLYGTGILGIAPKTAGGSFNVNTGGSGLVLGTATTSYIQSDWSQTRIGNTSSGNLTMGAAAWNDSTTFYTNNSSTINVTGAQTANGNVNLSFNTNNINLAANLYGGGGTGALDFLQTTQSNDINANNGTTGYHLSSSYIQSGWGQVILDDGSGSGNINLGTGTWLNPTIFKTMTGTVNVLGDQTVASTTGGLFFNSADVNIAGNLIGDGAGTTLTFKPRNGDNININSAGTGYNLSTAELAYIQPNWGLVNIGSNFSGADSSLNRNTYILTSIGGYDGRAVQPVGRLGADEDHGNEGGGSQCAGNCPHTAAKSEYNQPRVAA